MTDFPALVCPRCRTHLSSDGRAELNCDRCGAHFAPLGSGFDLLVPALTDLKAHLEQDREYWTRNRLARPVSPPLLQRTLIPKYISADTDRYVNSYYEFKRRLSEYEHKLLEWALRCVGKHVLARESAVLLDVGMGLGAFHLQFRDAFPSMAIVGVDIEPDGVLIAQQHGPGNAWYHRADGCHLPFADDTFDVVFSKNTVEHAGLPIIREMYRVQRPGGVSLLIGPGYVSHLTANPLKALRWALGLDPRVHGFTVGTYVAWAQAAGYRIVAHDAFCFNTIQRNLLQRWARSPRLPLPPRVVVDAVFGFNDLLEAVTKRLGWKAALWMQAFELQKTS